MNIAQKDRLLQNLQRTPASDLKRQGWPALVGAVTRFGRMLVTNHNQNQVVILSIDEYTTLVQAAESAESRQEAALAVLRERFDQRLASLKAADAGDRMRNVIKRPAKLEGKVKAGAGR